MSVTILLIPAIIAAISAASAAGAAGAVGAGITHAGRGKPGSLQVETRMKNLGLLQEALRDLKATGVTAADDTVTATIDDLRLTMTRQPDGIWQAHFESVSGGEVDVDLVAEVVSELDTAYAGRVQSAVADRIRQNAGDAGLELVSESRDEDDTVTMVLNVRQGG